MKNRSFGIPAGQDPAAGPGSYRWTALSNTTLGMLAGNEQPRRMVVPL